MEIYQIYDGLVGTKQALKNLSIDCFGTNQHYIGRLNDFFQRRAQEGSDVGYDFLDVLPVRTYQIAQRHLSIPDPDLKALAQKAFYELHEWALAKVIGAGLKAETQNSNLAHLRAQYRLDSPLNMLGIARQDACKEG